MFRSFAGSVGACWLLAAAVACSGEVGGGGGGEDASPGGNQNPVAVLDANPVNGPAPLAVSFDGSRSSDPDGTIAAYTWDFGDGGTASGANAAHTFTANGSYLVTLTVTDDDGATAAATRTILVSADVIIPDGLLFFDDFNYAADRGGPDTVAAFQTAGWAWAKTEPAAGGGAKGFVYTATEVPDYTGAYPGVDNTHMLVLEALPTTMGHPEQGDWAAMQTDFYIQYGEESGPQTTLPANVWFQFWIMPTGGYEPGMKFIYPCRNYYPCTDLGWLGTAGTTSSDPRYEQVNPDGTTETLEVSSVVNTLPSPDLFVTTVATGADWTPPEIPFHYAGNGKLGQTDVSERLVGGRWTLMKMHIDLTGAQGVYEVWLKPMGGPWTKVSDWIGDVTPYFTWPVPSHQGHKMFRMPTTVGGVPALQNYPASYDSWTYVDDFAIGTREEDLPVYPY